MSSETKLHELYDRDFVQWTEDQATALRHAKSAGANLPLDWENLAEEIESLGKSLRRELRSQIRRILRHLFKFAASPATDPRAGWHATIADARAEIEDILRDSPSLQREIRDLVVEQAAVAAKLAAADLTDHGEPTDTVWARLTAGGFTADQVLTDWFPDRPES